jgi:5-methylcytosine-specific restriction endonuclease McrA
MGQVIHVADMLPEQLVKHRAYHRAWRARERVTNPEARQRDTLAARAWQKANPIRNAMNTYKGTAARKGREYALTDDQFIALVLADCTYCHASPNPLNGIDRVDNALGYTEGNVTTACRQCNVAKGTLSIDEFRAWAQRVRG